MTEMNNQDELDLLLSEMAETEVPKELAERILNAAPDHQVAVTARPLFWDRFLKPIFAGPSLAAALFLGISVGYASADTTDYTDTDFSYAFDDSSLWIDDYSNEEAL